MADVAQTEYINTDLIVRSEVDLSPLAKSLEASGLTTLSLAPFEETPWLGVFETEVNEATPHDSLDILLRAIEGLPVEAKSVWWNASSRVFDIGYQGGNAPFSHRNSLSVATLARVVQVNADLEITIYRCEQSPLEVDRHLNEPSSV